MKFTFGGGINELNDIAISPSEAISGQNFELGLGNTKFRPRPPFDLLGTATNTSEIHGIHQLIERDNTKTTLIAAGTAMYTWDGTTFTATSPVATVNANSEFHHVGWDLGATDRELIICDRTLNNVLLKWDGASLNVLGHGLGVDFYARYAEVANGRVILGNIKTATTEIPHMLVLSAFEDHETYDTSKRSGDGSFTTGLEAHYILTPDLRPINGMIQFKRTLIISTEGGRLYELVGDDSTNYKFEKFYSGSAAVGYDSFVNANDDVFYIRQGGVIESLRATVSYGDVGTDDISLPIRKTMKNNTGGRIVYDQTNRKVFFFLGGQVVVLFKDLITSDESPFSIYKTTHTSNFTTKAAEYMEYPGSSNKTVLFGDSTGNIYDMNGIGIAGDAGTDSIQTIRKLALQDFNYDQILAGRVYYRRSLECELSVTLEWGDENATTSLLIPIKGRVGASNINYFGGGKYFGDGDYFGEGDPVGNPVSKGFSAVGKGSSVFAEFQIDTVGNFEIDYIEVPDEDA